MTPGVWSSWTLGGDKIVGAGEGGLLYIVSAGGCRGCFGAVLARVDTGVGVVQTCRGRLIGGGLACGGKSKR